MTAGESRSDFKLLTDTPYLAPTGELWGVYYENYEENWPGYNGTALYLLLLTAWFTLVEHLSQQGPLPWRPSLSRNAAVTEQCQGRVAEICGTEFLHTLLAKPSDVAQKSALLVEQLSRIGKVTYSLRLRDAYMCQ